MICAGRSDDALLVTAAVKFDADASNTLFINRTLLPSFRATAISSEPGSSCPQLKTEITQRLEI